MNDEIIRRAERKAVVMEAQCRTSGGGFGKVSIIDLTPEGCALFTSGLPLREGQEVRITPQGFQTLPGMVRWTQGGYAGIQFDSPLYGPVAEHLQNTFAALGSDRGLRPDVLRESGSSASPSQEEERTMAYSGSCHCGAVRFTVADAIPTAAISCNCSHCRRKGLLLAFVSAEHFTLDSGEEALSSYLFNKHAITHRFCRTCGCQPFAEGRGKDGGETRAVNLRCVPDIDLDALELQKFDGASY